VTVGETTLLEKEMNDMKDIINRLCDLERRMAKIETQAIEQAEKWDTSDMAHRSGGMSVEQALDGLAETSREIDRPVKSYTGGEPQYATETPDDLLRQSEREGWRWARECEAEVVRVTDINQRLMAGAQELRDAQDAAEFDAAWSKLFKLFKEAI
jgi:hypothetical protein